MIRFLTALPEVLSFIRWAVSFYLENREKAWFAEAALAFDRLKKATTDEEKVKALVDVSRAWNSV